jgi:hypothetical protein
MLDSGKKMLRHCRLGRLHLLQSFDVFGEREEI